MTESSSSGESTPAIFMALLLTLVALSGMAYRWSAEEPRVDLTTSFWEPSPEETKAYLVTDGILLSEHSPQADEPDLLKGLRRVHDLGSFAARGEKVAEYREALTRLESLAKTYYYRHGAKGYRAAGVRLWNLYANALSTGRESDEAKSLGGAMGDEAGRAGLLDTDGEWKPGSWLILRMLYMKRWSVLIHQWAPGDTVLAPLERSLLPKWKAEAHADAGSPDLKTRLDYVMEAKALDSEYPDSHVRGILFARYGLEKSALEWLRRAAEESPDDTLLRKKVNQIERFIANGGRKENFSQ